ncbi:MAG: ABC transporter permease, partial [Proteobacteria bacterium]|nr:ABC transporter permease [Pseudomonadota bacterium]
MDNKNPKLTKTRQKKIISLVSIYWKRLALAAVCMIVVAAANGAMALLVKPVMDDIFINRNKEMLLLIPGIAILVFFLKGFGSYGSEYLMNYIGKKIIRFFRDSLYE